MERYVHIIKFRKCKIHSGDSQKVGDTDVSEWTGGSVTRAFNRRGVGKRSRVFTGWPPLQGDSVEGLSPARGSIDVRAVSAGMPTGHQEILVS